MKNQHQYFKSNNEAKSLVMPTAKILTKITHDGILDNNAIKTTSITRDENFFKNKTLKKTNFAKEIFDLQSSNLQNDYSIEFNNIDDNLNEEILINGENITDLSKEKDLNDFFNEKILKIKTNFRDVQIKSIKNNLEINELEDLLLNLSQIKSSKSSKVNQIFLDSQKYSEDFLYEKIENHYKCKCIKCENINKNKVKSFYDPKNYFKKISQDYEIEKKIIKKNDLEINIKEDFNNIKNNSIDIDKSEEIIYSQSILKKILESKICVEKKEYDSILESSNRKKSFFQNLKKEKFGLNKINLDHIDEMHRKLLESEKIFLKNNNKYGLNNE